MKDRIRGFVPCERLLRQVLMRLGQTFNLRESCVQRHGRMVGVLCQIEVSRPTKLFFDYERLLQQLKSHKKILFFHIYKILHVITIYIHILNKEKNR